MVAEEGHCDCDPMRGSNFQSHGGRQGGVHRGRQDVQVSGAAAGLVRQQLDRGPPEYQQGAPSMGTFRQVTMDGVGRDFCVRNVISRSSACGFTLWGVDLGVVGVND